MRWSKRVSAVLCPLSGTVEAVTELLALNDPKGAVLAGLWKQEAPANNSPSGLRSLMPARNCGRPRSKVTYLGGAKTRDLFENLAAAGTTRGTRALAIGAFQN